jgi:hypothetical protein
MGRLEEAAPFRLRRGRWQARSGCPDRTHACTAAQRDIRAFGPRQSITYAIPRLNLIWLNAARLNLG